MSHEPLVSVVVPVYNAGEYLLPSIKSVLAQSYKNLEILIVDDGSTDGCIDNLTRIKDSRVCIFTQENSGKSAAMNFALSKLTGKYYCIQDADDLSSPERIGSLVSSLENDKSVSAVFSGHDIIINEKRHAPTFREKTVEECAKDIAAFRMPSHDPTGMYRLSMIKDFKYDTELRIGQGFDYILRVGEVFPMKVSGECLYSYRINLNSNTRSSNSREQMIIKVLQKAYKRRGLDYQCFFDNEEKWIRESRACGQAYGVVPAFMQSVFDLRCNGLNGEALKEAVSCLQLHPSDPLYYKPLLCWLTPVQVMKYHHKIKALLKRKPD
ncbi:MAG: glycosyltransferase [Pseudomonadales bacterium]|nr:glycosyltransferase [Pseudomonadales bacterium]